MPGTFLKKHSLNHEINQRNGYKSYYNQLPMKVKKDRLDAISRTKSDE
jgi:hypothetical protein